MLNKKGFTLSEVMITMGVLGIIAAILIPAITSTQPDKNRVMFKKAYSTLEKVVSELINNETYYPSTEMLVDGITPAGLSYYGNATALGVPASDDKFCYLFSEKVNTLGTVNCSTSPGTFTTTDGVEWEINFDRFQTLADNYLLLMVDINGDKAPNCEARCGKPIPDQFWVAVRYDGKIMPAGEPDFLIDVLTNPTQNKKD